MYLLNYALLRIRRINVCGTYKSSNPSSFTMYAGIQMCSLRVPFLLFFSSLIGSLTCSFITPDNYGIGSQFRQCNWVRPTRIIWLGVRFINASGDQRSLESHRHCGFMYPDNCSGTGTRLTAQDSQARHRWCGQMLIRPKRTLLLKIRPQPKGLIIGACCRYHVSIDMGPLRTCATSVGQVRVCCGGVSKCKRFS